ncbi:GAF domain-containing protein [Robbsia sp. Bb-Pol-6]|uniref:GAF domain-containing protein n=1 Tax=Robbsia betulipollinis TaxID=2981849 RepID=A0ABT3ZK01_9BURK|nr:GAF domain-containing protein [Robbsia betulipollinis]MCY0386861.1 GAF domain-containing protein [Robbsia betulipollinis]
MPEFPVIYNEEARLAAVEQCGLMDSPSDARFDRITRLAAFMTSTPMAVVSLVGAQRQWFKSRHGLEAREISREWAFCNYTLVDQALFTVEDASRDPRFAQSPMVQGSPHLRFYAGVPLSDEQGHRVGVLCVMDTVPRHLTNLQRHALRDLGNLAADALVTAALAVAAARIAAAASDLSG